MQFKIGPWVYSVIISPERIYDDDGNEAPAQCLWAQRRIEISGFTPLECRREALFHELHHLWRWHLGQAHGDEDQANNASAFTAMCMDELAAQGGEAALKKLVPEDQDASVATEESRSIETYAFSGPGGRNECGFCGTQFSSGQGVTGTPFFNAAGMLVVSRAVYCDGCNEVHIWHEGAMHDGSPNGQPVGSVRRLRGADASAWLKANGDRIGVMVA